MQYINNTIQQLSTLGDKRSTYLIVIIAITFLCFAPNIQNDFLHTWDDDIFILHNEHIRSLSVETVRWAFFESLSNNWTPLTWISLALDHAFWGLNPAGYHITNNSIHAITAALFFFLSLELVKHYLSIKHHEDAKRTILNQNNALYCAFVAALYFSIHPLRVESVSWLSERKDVLSLFFAIPSIMAYLKYVQTTNPLNKSSRKPAFIDSTYYWIAITCYFLSLLSKPTLVTLPLVLLVLDWFPLKRINRLVIKDVLLEKVPFMLLSVLISWIIMNAYTTVQMPFSDSNIQSRILIALKSIMAYLCFTIWPANLSPFYLHPMNITTVSLEYIVPIIFFVVMTGCSLLLIQRQPAILSAWLIYIITLLPVLGFVQVGNAAMADRYTYIPGLPVSLIFALGATVATARYSGSRATAVTTVIITLAILFTNGFFTIRQIHFWRNDISLWSGAIDVQPHFSGRTYFQRSKAYKLNGDYINALTDINEALRIATLKKIHQLDNIYVERADTLKHLGDFRGAISDYSTAIMISNKDKRSLYYQERADVYNTIGRFDLANEDIRSAALSQESK